MVLSSSMTASTSAAVGGGSTIVESFIHLFYFK
jgi:hypothetical protein